MGLPTPGVRFHPIERRLSLVMLAGHGTASLGQGDPVSGEPQTTMTQNEREQLLNLFVDKQRWSQGSEARTESGDPVSFDDDSASAWDLVGGLCKLFGWKRANQLFDQLHRHIIGQTFDSPNQASDSSAMSALIDYNDASDTTYEKMMATLRDIPAWGGTEPIATSGTP